MRFQSLALTLALALVSADPVPEPGHPVRLSVLRGSAPGPHMAKMIEESIRKDPGRIVYPEVLTDGNADGDPNNIDDYPTCSKVCTPPALEASGCEFPHDIECMCHCPIFGDLAYNCEVEKCSEADIHVIHVLGNKMCEPVGGFQPKRPESCKVPPADDGGKKKLYKVHEGLKERL